MPCLGHLNSVVLFSIKMTDDGTVIFSDKYSLSVLKVVFVYRIILLTPYNLSNPFQIYIKA